MNGGAIERALFNAVKSVYVCNGQFRVQAGSSYTHITMYTYMYASILLFCGGSVFLC